MDSDRRNRIANGVSGVHEADSDREDDGAENPHPDLRDCALGSFERRMEAVVNAEQEE